MEMAKTNSTLLNLQDSETQADFSYPLSIPSQPPDIKNWFSSYQYESPDSSDIPCAIDSSELPANGDGETQDPLEISGVQNDEGSSAAMENGCLSEERSWDESCRGTDHIQLKDDRNPLQESKRKCDDDIGCNSSIAILNSDTSPGKFLKRPLARMEREHNLQQAKNAEAENGLNTPQNQQVFLNSTDGFITIKKRETGRSLLPSISHSMNRENQASMNGLKERGTRERSTRDDLKENNGTKARRERLEEPRAGALADRTNVLVERGIPGKWQCPRKRKPYVGPPLKQLRLEQWVRRVD